MKILITGFTDDYSVVYSSLKYSKFKKPTEIISLKEKIHPMLASLAREKKILLKEFYFDNSIEWKQAIEKRNREAIKYCNRIINLGKPNTFTKLAESMKKKVFSWEYWNDNQKIQ